MTYRYLYNEGKGVQLLNKSLPLQEKLKLPLPLVALLGLGLSLWSTKAL